MNFIFNTLLLISLFQYPVMSIDNNRNFNAALYNTTTSTNQAVIYTTDWQEDNQTDAPQSFNLDFYYGYNSVSDYIVHVGISRRASAVTTSTSNFSYWIYTDLDIDWGNFDYGIYYPSFTTIITFSDYAGIHNYVINDYSYPTSDLLELSSICDVPIQEADNSIIDTRPMDNFTISCAFLMDSEFIYNQGYTQGRFDALNSTQWRLDNYLFAIADIPFYVMRNFFNDSLFGGPSLFIILMSLITVGIIITLVKKFL